MADGLFGDDVTEFRRNLMRWYSENARVLPWRGVDDPYKVWISEIMLQQTRVQAVMEHYRLFLKKFPTIKKLAAADEQEVLAAWSGLGYYRRARMMHAAAKAVVAEYGGVLPRTAVELRALPGIGEYTSAAIASIAFGESVAVVDGNVERVLLRVTGRPEDASAAGKRFVAEQARVLSAGGREQGIGNRGRAKAKAKTEADSAAALRNDKQIIRLRDDKKLGLRDDKKPGLQDDKILGSRDDKRFEAGGRGKTNAAGEHNQAMMELGAMVCLPRGALCGECPVYSLCRTRGEHVTVKRAKGLRREVAYLFATRMAKQVSKRQGNGEVEVMLVQRAADASLMAGMWELPPLSAEVVAPFEPVLAVKHSITNTNYDVSVYAARELEREVAAGETVVVRWVRAGDLTGTALTGLTRKILRKMKVMQA
ncbi:MAG TPA: A/G-specific adenine glycosylase [Acidobacteriaceae bacterium]